MQIQLPKLKCLRCGYEWTPRTGDVRLCANPKCRSAFWDKPKEEKDGRNMERNT